MKILIYSKSKSGYFPIKFSSSAGEYIRIFIWLDFLSYCPIFQFLFTNQYAYFHTIHSENCTSSLIFINMSQTNTSKSASEHRGAFGGQPTDRNINSMGNNENNRNAPKKPLSFSNTVKASLFPKKDQAIIYPAIDGLQVKDYVVETGKLVNPQNIQFASRMSNNRICIYFNTKELVNRFIEKEGGITINQIFVPARKLIMPAKRIIVSNVSPCIPHHVLEEKIKEENIKIVSPISFIGAGIGVEQYKHVLSFRRQFFVAEESSGSIPSSLMISFDNEEYRVYLTDDQMRCFRCKETGHVAAKCMNTADEANILDETSENTAKRPPPSSTNTLDDDIPPLTQDSENEVRSEDENNTLETAKINQSPLKNSECAKPDSRDLSQDDTFRQPARPQKTSKAKRRKVDDSQSTDEEEQEDLQEIEVLWKKDNDYVIDFLNFTEFLRNVKGRDKPADIAKRYTSDLEGLIEIIKDARPLISKRATKERCRRLSSSLIKALQSQGKDISSLCRSSSIESISSEKSSY